jgi:hypothetical protein
MSKDNKEHDSSHDAAEEVRRAFAALPFEQQISTLIRVELDMVGEAVDTIVSAASRAANDLADAFNRGYSSTAEKPGTSGAATP